MVRIAVVKAGSTFSNTARRLGDFEDWTCNGLGVALDQVTFVEAQNRDRLPSTKDISGAVVTGSHAMVTDGLDWCDILAGWIKRLVEAEVPFLGVCFGHQLLAKAMGGKVGNHHRGVEIGSVDIELLPASCDDRLFGDLPQRFCAHVAHTQTVLSLPPEAVRLAANNYEPCHAFRIGSGSWGVQFHPEFDTDIMNAYIDAHAHELEIDGRDLLQIRDSVRNTPVAASILGRFGRLVTTGNVNLKGTA